MPYKIDGLEKINSIIQETINLVLEEYTDQIKKEILSQLQEGDRVIIGNGICVIEHADGNELYSYSVNKESNEFVELIADYAYRDNFETSIVLDFN